MPATTVVPRDFATRSTSVVNGPSSGSAYGDTSEPASPKSRAKASGSTTRSAPSGTSDSRRSRFSVGSSDEASCTSTTCMAPSLPPWRTMDRMSWAAVILTGGTSARLDGTDKASLTHAGRSLLEITLGAVADAAEVVVVGSRTSTSRPVTFTRESPSYGGPLAGIAAGVAALTGDHDLVVVLAVDMPRVTAGTVARLVAAVGDGDAAWLVDATGRRQLAAAVRPGLVPAPREATGLPVRVLMGAGRSTDV